MRAEVRSAAAAGLACCLPRGWAPRVRPLAWGPDGNEGRGAGVPAARELPPVGIYIQALPLLRPEAPSKHQTRVAPRPSHGKRPSPAGLRPGPRHRKSPPTPLWQRPSQTGKLSPTTSSCVPTWSPLCAASVTSHSRSCLGCRCHKLARRRPCLASSSP